MKQSKYITLIDLDGKPIKHKYDNLSGISCRCESESVFGQVIAYEVLIGNCVVFSGKADDRELARKLVDFLNDQLTFIRNGMWETLAIYQATLGAYTEVPVYRTTKSLLVDLIKIGGHTGTWADGYSYDSSFLEKVVYKDHKLPRGFGSSFKPYMSVFIKHYPDVFSKLTPWKEESTDSTH